MAKTEQIDFRSINLKDPDHREFLDKMMKVDIDSGEMVMSSEGMHEQWLINNMYIEDKQVPVGSKSDYLQEFIRKNADNGKLDLSQFRVKKDEDDVIFVVDNKIGEVVKGKDSEFADAEREIFVKNDDNPRNNRIEKAVETKIKQAQDKYKTWRDYYFPAIKQKHRLGLFWVQVFWNRSLGEGGDVEWKRYHPRDVLIEPVQDPLTFLDINWLIPKTYMKLEDAQDYLFTNFGIAPEDVKPDSDYYWTGDSRIIAPPTSGPNDTGQQYVTIYLPEYKKTYYDGPFKRQMTVYFQGVYNKQLGMLDWRVNKYADPLLKDQWQFSLSPFYEEISALRLFPIGMVEKFIPIQDIINVMRTLQLDNARQRNKLRMLVKARLTDMYGQAANDFINTGGFWPVETMDVGEKMSDSFAQVEYPQLPPEVLNFLDAMEMSMKYQGERKEVLGGRLPDARGEYLSGKTIDKITERNLVRLKPDELTVNWTISNNATRFYNITAMETDASEWMEIEGKKKGDKKYVPINTTISMAEYDQLLAELYPDMVEQMEDGSISTLKAAEEFEKENDVDYDYATEDEMGRELTIEQIKKNYSAVKLNYLHDDDGNIHKMTVKVTFDFGFQNNEEVVLQILGGLLKNNPNNLPLLKRYLRRMPGEIGKEADDIVQEIEESNEMLQFAKGIFDKGPEMVQFVQQMIQALEQGGLPAAMQLMQQMAQQQMQQKQMMAAQSGQQKQGMVA